MTTPTLLFSPLFIPAVSFRGPAFFAGLPPLDDNSPDGRFRVLNEPAMGRIVVYERSSMTPVVETLSDTDGTWRVDHLDPDIYYTVIGWDGTGQQNAAIQDWVKPHVPE